MQFIEYAIAMTDYERLAQRLKLMAHPERLRMLDILRRSPECVCHLEALMGRPQPYISQQVRLLHRAGVLQSEKRGQNTFYRVSNPEMLAWLSQVLGPVPEVERGIHRPLPDCVCPKCQRGPVLL
ncbi:MAG TPA: winged helix-turn-helix transcriptional regulator [Caldilineae bacterium]|nr:winged helix-turn-helix transcriptional regulator [Caldilineae bacterium]